MIAAVTSATLLGVTGLPVTVEVHVGPGHPDLPDRRSARRGLPRIARPRARRGAVERVRVAAASASPSTSRRPACARAARVSTWPSPSPSCWPTSRSSPPCTTACRSSASWVSTVRFVRWPAWRRWWRASRISKPWFPRRRGTKRQRLPSTRCAASRRCARSFTHSPAADGPTRHRRPTGRTSRRRPTWPMCAVSPTRASPSSWPRRVGTTCCWSGHRGRARRCWRSASSGCCRRSITSPRSRPP